MWTNLHFNSHIFWICYYTDRIDVCWIKPNLTHSCSFQTESQETHAQNALFSQKFVQMKPRIVGTSDNQNSNKKINRFIYYIPTHNYSIHGTVPFFDSFHSIIYCDSRKFVYKRYVIRFWFLCAHVVAVRNHRQHIFCSVSGGEIIRRERDREVIECAY